MNTRSIKLDEQWLTPLAGEFDQAYMRELSAFLRTEKAAGKVIYPAGKNIFNALNSTPLSQVKVVILGQDPYHGPGQAHGLSFSVPNDIAPPPSLKNIYKELHSDLDLIAPTHGNLQAWADQGVLLLNAVLTVEHAQAASHQNRGWERFTDKVIQVINSEQHNVVFMLWGAYAQKKGRVIDRDRHLVLTAPHPSPLSAHRGFLGCKHFSQANHYLVEHNSGPINWQLS